MGAGRGGVTPKYFFHLPEREINKLYHLMAIIAFTMTGVAIDMQYTVTWWGICKAERKICKIFQHCSEKYKEVSTTRSS